MDKIEQLQKQVDEIEEAIHAKGVYELEKEGILKRLERIEDKLNMLDSWLSALSVQVNNFQDLFAQELNAPEKKPYLCRDCWEIACECDKK